MSGGERTGLHHRTQELRGLRCLQQTVARVDVIHRQTRGGGRDAAIRPWAVTDDEGRLFRDTVFVEGGLFDVKLLEASSKAGPVCSSRRRPALSGEIRGNWKTSRSSSNGDPRTNEKLAVDEKNSKNERPRQKTTRRGGGHPSRAHGGGGGGVGGGVGGGGRPRQPGERTDGGTHTDGNRSE